MEKQAGPVVRTHKPYNYSRHRLTLFTLAALTLGSASFLVISLSSSFSYHLRGYAHIPLHAEETLSKCRSLLTKPGPPPDFNVRKASDRFQGGTKATLITNATIWTGRNDGLEIIKGDILLDNGLMKAVGVIPKSLVKQYREDDLVRTDAGGAWITPG